ncbi:MAG: hypothetical protein M1536_03680 [Firmicutes bacterium]|nr:hypothetical protein [Bacillota bacterium]
MNDTIIEARRARIMGLGTEEIAQQVYYSMRGGLTNEFYRLAKGSDKRDGV